jgi:hypothetical protein
MQLRFLEAETDFSALNPYFFCIAFSFSFSSGGIFGNKKAICSLIPHGEPFVGWTALP